MIFGNDSQLFTCGCPTGTVCNCASIDRMTANEQARLSVQKGITPEYLRILNRVGVFAYVGTPRRIRKAHKLALRGTYRRSDQWALSPALLEKGTDMTNQNASETGSESSKCPWCGGPADNGHDRGIPPSAYLCSKCADSDRAKRNLEYNLLIEQ